MSNDLISRSALLKEINNFSIRITGSANAMAIAIMEETKKSIVKMIDEQPTAYDNMCKIMEQLENCVDSTTFMYDKETGILYEVEADVWARIADGTEVEIPIKSAVIE